MGLLINVPKVGQVINVMGMRAEVIAVEPHSDWEWHIELTSRSISGLDEVWSMNVPTDYHTTTGTPVVQPSAGSEAVDDLPSLKCAWDKHGDCRDTTCGCDCHPNNRNR